MPSSPLASVLLALFALALASVELTASYRFYQVNAYKIALALLLITMLVPFALWAGLRRRLPAPSVGLLVLWTLPMLVTLPGWWHTQGQWAYGAAEQLTQGVIVVLWAWLAWALAQAGYGMRLMGVMFYLGSATALLALVEMVQQRHLPPEIFRARTSFGNPGYLAGFLLLLMPLGMARIMNVPSAATLESRNGRRFGQVAAWLRWSVEFALSASTILALLLTKTRVAQLIAVVAVAGFVLWQLPKVIQHLPLPRGITRFRPLLYPMMAVITLGAGGWIVTQFDVWARFQILARLDEWQGRLVPWEAAINAFYDSPWLGHGPGSYYSLFFNFVHAESRAFWIERSYFDPHNLLLDMAVEGGVLGVGVGVGIWLVWLGLLWHYARRNTNLALVQRQHAVAVLAGLLLMLAFSLTAVSYRMMTLMLPTQVILAIAIGMVMPARASKPWVWSTVPVLIAVAWLLGQNGLYAKQRFVAISALPQGERYKALQTLCQQSSNIYALERLLQEALIHADWPQFFRTARQMEETIPNYRTARHVIAQGYMRRGDWRNARKAALDYQQRDRYYADNNKLLVRLAVLTNDDELMLAQMRNAMHFSLHKQGFLSERSALVRLRVMDPLAVSVSDDPLAGVEISIPVGEMNWLMNATKKYYRERFPNKKLETENQFRFFLAPLVAQVQAKTGKDRFVEDMLLQLL